MTPTPKLPTARSPFATALWLGLALWIAGPGCGGDDDGGASPDGGGASSYTVGGTVTGLSGTLVLENNGGDALTLTADGPFTFDTALEDGDAFDVSIATQPAGETCSVTGGSGTIAGADETGVSVTCLRWIVFNSRRALDGSDASGPVANIWFVLEDGSGLRPLTDATAAGADSTDPELSPDASRVAFVSSRKVDGSDAAEPDGTRNVWVVNTDGTGAAAVTTNTAAGADASFPRWSPDGSALVFYSRANPDGGDSESPNQISNIFVVGADGDGYTALTELTAAGASSRGPRWSPDGSQIAYFSYRVVGGGDEGQETANIWVMDASGDGSTPLTSLTAADADSFGPEWSPDGTQLVFHSGRKLDGSDASNGPHNIWVVGADGGGAAPVTELEAASTSDPVWSPDGAWIAYDSHRDPDGDDVQGPVTNIWVVRPDGTGSMAVTDLTADGADSDIPRWSSGSDRIVCESARDLDGGDAVSENAVYNVWSLATDGSEAVPVTRTTAADTGNFGPRFAP